MQADCQIAITGKPGAHTGAWCVVERGHL